MCVRQNAAVLGTASKLGIGKGVIDQRPHARLCYPTGWREPLKFRHAIFQNANAARLDLCFAFQLHHAIFQIGWIVRIVRIVSAQPINSFHRDRHLIPFRRVNVALLASAATANFSASAGWS